MPITENTQRTIDNLLLGAYTQSAKTTNFPRKRIDPLPSGTQVASDDFKDLCFAEKKRFLELLAVYGKDFVDQYRHKVNLNNGKQLKARTVLKLDAKGRKWKDRQSIKTTIAKLSIDDFRKAAAGSDTIDIFPDGKLDTSIRVNVPEFKNGRPASVNLSPEQAEINKAVKARFLEILELNFGDKFRQGWQTRIEPDSGSKLKSDLVRDSFAAGNENKSRDLRTFQAAAIGANPSDKFFQLSDTLNDQQATIQSTSDNDKAADSFIEALMRDENHFADITATINFLQDKEQNTRLKESAKQGEISAVYAECNLLYTELNSAHGKGNPIQADSTFCKNYAQDVVDKETDPEKQLSPNAENGWQWFDQALGSIFQLPVKIRNLIENLRQAPAELEKAIAEAPEKRKRADSQLEKAEANLAKLNLDHPHTLRSPDDQKQADDEIKNAEKAVEDAKKAIDDIDKNITYWEQYPSKIRNEITTAIDSATKSQIELLRRLNDPKVLEGVSAQCQLDLLQISDSLYTVTVASLDPEGGIQQVKAFALKGSKDPAWADEQIRNTLKKHDVPPPSDVPPPPSHVPAPGVAVAPPCDAPPPPQAAVPPPGDLPPPLPTTVASPPPPPDVPPPPASAAPPPPGGVATAPASTNVTAIGGTTTGKSMPPSRPPPPVPVYPRTMVARPLPPTPPSVPPPPLPFIPPVPTGLPPNLPGRPLPAPVAAAPVSAAPVPVAPGAPAPVAPAPYIADAVAIGLMRREAELLAKRFEDSYTFIIGGEAKGSRNPDGSRDLLSDRAAAFNNRLAADPEAIEFGKAFAMPANFEATRLALGRHVPGARGANLSWQIPRDLTSFASELRNARTRDHAAMIVSDMKAREIELNKSIADIKQALKSGIRSSTDRKLVNSALATLEQMKVEINWQGGLWEQLYTAARSASAPGFLPERAPNELQQVARSPQQARDFLTNLQVDMIGGDNFVDVAARMHYAHSTLHNHLSTGSSWSDLWTTLTDEQRRHLEEYRYRALLQMRSQIHQEFGQDIYNDAPAGQMKLVTNAPPNVALQIRRRLDELTTQRFLPNRNLDVQHAFNAEWASPEEQYVPAGN